MQKVRGAEIALVFQEPMTALNPVFTIGNQIEETLLVHGRAHAARPRAPKAIELLDAGQHPRAGSSACATIRTSCRAASGSAR